MDRPAQLAYWRFDDTRILGDALSPLVGDLLVWCQDGRQACLTARLAYVDVLR